MAHVFRVLQDDGTEDASFHVKRTNAYLGTIKLSGPDRIKLVARANQFKELEAVLAQRAADVHAQSAGPRTPDQRKVLQELSKQNTTF